MNKLDLESYKGVRDFYPEDYKVFDYIISKWREVLKSYGFEEYNASILEPSELYQSKTSDEIVNEQTYNFIDRGNRNVTLRPEMTPSVTRMIAKKRREFSLPIKWFSIPNVFRYEQPQKGRLREHWQLNADMFGISENTAEVEIIQIASDLMLSFGLSQEDFVIKINDREIINRTFAELNLNEEQSKKLLKLIDRKEKINNFGEEAEKIIGKQFNYTPEMDSKLKKLVETLNGLGVNNIVFDPLLVRGFDYYTGVIFEIFDTNPENKRALFGGGRYDKLFEIFDQTPLPAVGFGMGDVTIKDALEIRGLLPTFKPSAPIYIGNIDADALVDSEKLVAEIRKTGVNVYFDFTDRKIKNKIERAGKQGYRFFAAIGQNEITSKKIIIKNLETGKEKKIKINKIKKFLDNDGIMPLYEIFSI
jgi:histidyl-tRNA synthetase